MMSFAMEAFLIFPLLTTALITTTPLLSRRPTTNRLQNNNGERLPTSLNQLLQPSKGGVVVDAPPDGFIARDPLIDVMMGRADGDGGEENNGGGFDDAVILGGNPTFTSRSSGQFAPQQSARSGAPRPPNSPPAENLPLFPDLKASQSNSGPRRISPGESAVFERRVATNKSGSGRASANSASKSAYNQGQANGYGPRIGSAGDGNQVKTNQGNFNSPKGVSIKGDSSIFSSTGFVGGGGSTNVFSGGASSNSNAFNSGIRSGNSATSFSSGPGSRSRATSSSFNSGNSIGNGGGNVGNSFRDGTGRDYSSNKFGRVARNAGRQQQPHQRESGGVSIKGDSSIFSSTGFVGGGNTGNSFTSTMSGYDTSGTRAGRGQSGMRSSSTSVNSSTLTYSREHVFDGPSRQPVSDTRSEPSYSSTTTINYNDGTSFTGIEIDATPSYMPSFNTKQSMSIEDYATNYNAQYTPSPPPPNTYNSGQSLADNFLTTNNSVRRSGPIPNGDDDYDLGDYDDDGMIGYESTNRRGDSFLTEPEERYKNIKIHTGKWISELYMEQGLDVFSGGSVGYGAIKGEVEKGRGGGTGASSSSGYGGSNGYGNSNEYQVNNGYGSGYSGNSNGYPSYHGSYGNGSYDIDSYSNSDGYVNNNYNGGQRSGGTSGSFDSFGQPPAGGY